MFFDSLQLDRAPFAKDLSVDQLFLGQGFREAKARLQFLAETSGIGLITGETGSGKSTLLRLFAESLDQSSWQYLYTPFSTLRSSGLLRTINAALGLEPRRAKADLLVQFLKAAQALPNRLVMLFDEAHLFSPETLEDVRLMTNTHFDSHAPFTLVIAGQPPLQEILKLKNMASFEQRITVRYRLTGLTKEETFQYIAHHFKLAGAKHSILADDVITAIFHASRGLPRITNNLSTASLIAAASQNRKEVDLQLYHDTVRDIEAN